MRINMTMHRGFASSGLQTNGQALRAHTLPEQFAIRFFPRNSRSSRRAGLSFCESHFVLKCSRVTTQRGRRGGRWLNAFRIASGVGMLRLIRDDAGSCRRPSESIRTIQSPTGSRSA
jgi:hypothetical protein